MLHTMPDKTVRVTSRYPKGHGTVFFDLAKAHGFTLEKDGYNPDTLVLQAVGCYGDYTARYGDPVEAEADLADLTTMLGDRHYLPSRGSRSAPSGAAKRKGWGWKGAVAGLAIGALGAHFAPNWRTADTSAVHAAALGDALPHPGSGADGDFIPARGPLPYSRLPAFPPIPAAPAGQQSPPRTPAPAANFGLQP